MDEAASVPDSAASVAAKSVSAAGGFDFTAVPHLLDANFDSFGNGSVLRSVIIRPGHPWSRQRQPSLVARALPLALPIYEDGTKSEMRKAFDLMDALTKSGALVMDHTSL